MAEAQNEQTELQIAQPEKEEKKERRQLNNKQQTMVRLWMTAERDNLTGKYTPEGLRSEAVKHFGDKSWSRKISLSLVNSIATDDDVRIVRLHAVTKEPLTKTTKAAAEITELKAKVQSLEMSIDAILLFVEEFMFKNNHDTQYRQRAAIMRHQGVLRPEPADPLAVPTRLPQQG